MAFTGKTLELLDRALNKNSAAEWARVFNITPSAFTQARKRGRLSPVMAGNLAMAMGEDVHRWTAAAGMEAEPDSPLKFKLSAYLQNR